MNRQLVLKDVRINPSMVPSTADGPAAALCSAVSNVSPGRRGAGKEELRG